MTKRRLSALVCLFFAGMGLVAGQAAVGPFTDAQLLRAERHKSAVLQYQLARQALDARAKDLQQEEAALNKDLCGEGQFDFGTTTCVKPVKAVEKP